MTQEIKDLATSYVRHLWHVPEYRYFDIQSASRSQILDLASMAYRSQLSSHYRQALEHPRSKKAMETIYETAKSLASLYT